MSCKFRSLRTACSWASLLSGAPPHRRRASSLPELWHVVQSEAAPGVDRNPRSRGAGAGWGRSGQRSKKQVASYLAARHCRLLKGETSQKACEMSALKGCQRRWTLLKSTSRGLGRNAAAANMHRSSACRSRKPRTASRTLMILVP